MKKTHTWGDDLLTENIPAFLRQLDDNLMSLCKSSCQNIVPYYSLKEFGFV